MCQFADGSNSDEDFFSDSVLTSGQRIQQGIYYFIVRLLLEPLGFFRSQSN